MYQVTASIVRHYNNGHSVSSVGIQIPTFYLSENVQGITGIDHAREIAKEMICKIVSPLNKATIETFDIYTDVIFIGGDD